jgi:hypothetical protein
VTTAVGSYATLADFKQRANLGTAVMADDDLISDICDQVNAWIEENTGRILAPWGTAAATAYYSIEAEADHLYVPEGVTSVTSLEIARYTSAAYELVPAADYFLQPDTPDPGWPYTWLYLTDFPTTGIATRFYRGFRTVRLVGMFGWPAIPDDVTDLALAIAIRTWFARQAGQSDIIGATDAGMPVVSRVISPRDRDSLRRYTVPSRIGL